MNDLNQKKQVLTDALTQSFVDDYDAFRSIVNNINDDFKVLEMDYEYTYDTFCVNFLEESLNKLEEEDIFKYTNFKDFYENFWSFNLFVIKTLLIKKFAELGYDYDEYDKLINKTEYISGLNEKNP